jgi:hypothetical protein
MSHIRNANLFGNQVDVPWTPILKVRAGNLAAVGDVKNLRLCLRAGVNTGQDSRANNKNGRAALIRACISDQYSAVELLLELGAEVISICLHCPGNVCYTYIAHIYGPLLAHHLLLISP